MRTLICLVAVLLSGAAAEVPPSKWEYEKGITAGKLVDGSASPDGKFALFEFNHWEAGRPDGVTTITGVGLAPADRSVLLYAIDSRTEWGTDKKVTSFLTVRWSPDSSLLATHDSGPKHSKLNIYLLKGGHAMVLKVPDLLPVACAKLGVTPSEVSGSGEPPAKWISPNELEVMVRLKANARDYSVTVPLQVTTDGEVKVGNL